jgi:uncharacterized protein (TIGR04255 family)
VDVTTDACVNLTLALDSTKPDGPTPVILDIDAYKITDLDPKDEKIWEILENLRTLKNNSFFSTLTEQAVELYE